MSSQPNQSLIDGIRCFQERTASDVPLGTRHLARQLNFNPVRINRLLMTLKMIRLVSQNHQKKYYPGPAVHLLATQSYHRSKVLQVVIPLLEQYSYNDRVIALGVLWGDSVSYLYHTDNHKKGIKAIGAYPLFDVVKSSIGQVLLSQHDDELVKQILKDRSAKEVDFMLSQARFGRDNQYIHLYNENDQNHNIAVKISLDGIDMGLAFTDMKIKETIKSYLDELRDLSAEIEAAYYKS